jgi:hypothetical protein
MARMGWWLFTLAPSDGSSSMTLNSLNDLTREKKLITGPRVIKIEKTLSYYEICSFSVSYKYVICVFRSKLVCL